MGYQTSVVSDPAVAVPGMLFDLQEPYYAVSGAVQPSGGLIAGRFVKYGSSSSVSEATFDVLAASSDVPLIAGALIKDFTTEQPAAGGIDFIQYAGAAAMRVGRLWVLNANNGALTQNLIPYIIFTGADAGKVSLTNPGGNTGLQIPGVQVFIPGAGNALVCLSINLPAGTTP